MFVPFNNLKNVWILQVGMGGNKDVEGSDDEDDDEKEDKDEKEDNDEE